MTQNTSSAVMQQRREPHDSLDDFPTPPWATRALIHHLTAFFWWPYVDDQSVREPCANRGHMVRPLTELFASVEASDIHDYGVGFPVNDYLFGPPPARTDWTITNPPFRLAQQFICRALECSDNVAMFVRSAFLEGGSRYSELFRPHRPSVVLQFAERVVLHRGKLVDPDVPVQVWSEKDQAFAWRKPSTATSYSWIVWDSRKRTNRTDFDWIPPCRKRFERPGDYAFHAFSEVSAT